MSHQQTFERRLQEWCVWYHEHLPTVKRANDLKRSTEFLAKAVDGAYELLILSAECLREVRNIEDRPKIVLPTGVKLHDPIREDDGE